MPNTLTPEVAAFRRSAISMFLMAAAAAVQGVDQRLRCLVMPPPLDSRDRIHTGADDWSKLAAGAGVDGICVLLPWYGTDTEMDVAIAEVCAEADSACGPHGKDVLLWVTGTPRDGYQTIETLRSAVKHRVSQVVIADYDLALQRVAGAGLVQEFRQFAHRLTGAG
jgi:hypothetical protein